MPVINVHPSEGGGGNGSPRPPPPNKNVSFQPGLQSIGENSAEVGPTKEEKDLISQLEPIVGENADTILKAIRRTTRMQSWNGEQYVSAIIESLYTQQEIETRAVTPHNDFPPLTPERAQPVQGCAERPTQTENPDSGKEMFKTKELSKSEREEMDIKKAIEESLLSTAHSSTPSYEASQPADPRDMRRPEGHNHAVGLHNIGNSCWFNVVAQALFHLPELRRVLYTARTDTEGEDKETRLLSLMRRLFAEMDASNRKYVDPSAAVRAVGELYATEMRGGETIIGVQQDAVEMLLKMVQWMESGLRREAGEQMGQAMEVDTQETGTGRTHDAQAQCTAQCSPLCSSASVRVDAMEISPAVSVSSVHGGSGDKEQAEAEPHFAVPHPPALKEESREIGTGGPPKMRSPLERIFHGRTVEMRADAPLTDVLAREESELMMWQLNPAFGQLHDAIEAYQFGQAEKEQWVECLPGVIVFTLSRFQYSDGRTVKLHDRFEFPRHMYMDRKASYVLCFRYLVSRAGEVRDMRAKRMEQRKRLADLEARIRGFSEFPCGEGTMPLSTILEAVQKYVDGTATAKSPSDSSVFPLRGPVPATPANTKPSTPCCLVRDVATVVPREEGMDGGTRAAVENALATMRIDAATKEQVLRGEAEGIRRDIDGTFDGMNKEAYSLHAAIIHDGEATVGHYWMYVKKGDVWLKINDKTCEVADEEQMNKDAFGSAGSSCSAYCLFYARNDAGWLFDYASPDCSPLNRLPADLREYVMADNEELDKQMTAFSLRVDPSGVRMAAVDDATTTRRCGLAQGVGAVFPDDETRRAMGVQLSLLESRFATLYYPLLSSTHTTSFDAASLLARHAAGLFIHIGKEVLQCIGEQLNIDVAAADEQQAALIFDMYMCDFWELAMQCMPVPRCLQSAEQSRGVAASWLAAAGRRVSTKAHQIMLVCSLAKCGHRHLEALAQKEHAAFKAALMSTDHIDVYKHASLQYDLFCRYWQLIRRCATELEHCAYPEGVTRGGTGENAWEPGKDKLQQMHSGALALCRSAMWAVRVRRDVHTEMGWTEGGEGERWLASEDVHKALIALSVIRLSLTLLLGTVHRRAPISHDRFNEAVRTWLCPAIKMVKLWADAGHAGSNMVVSQLSQTWEMCAQSSDQKQSMSMAANLIASGTQDLVCALSSPQVSESIVPTGSRIDTISDMGDGVAEFDGLDVVMRNAGLATQMEIGYLVKNHLDKSIEMLVTEML